MTPRLENLETDVALLKHNAVHATELLVAHSERLAGLQRGLDGLQRGLDDLRHEVGDLRTSLEARLDRLIAVTSEERTAHYERLDALERRVGKLEDDR